MAMANSWSVKTGTTEVPSRFLTPCHPWLLPDSTLLPSSGDKVKVHKDKSGALRTMHACLDRDTYLEAILKCIKLWIPAGRILDIASDEKEIHYFEKLTLKYRIVKAENIFAILGQLLTTIMSCSWWSGWCFWERRL